MELVKSIFREYDIRGIYKKELDETTAYLIGRAFGTKLVRLGIKETVVAHDNRLSSPSLEQSLVKGLLETGTNVKRLGLATTPMCYFAANYLGTNCSMMITASHNPKEYNGFKFSYNGIHNAYGEAVLEIYNLIKNNDFESGTGIIENVDVDDAYINLVVSKLDFGKRKIKVVYDCGNGTSSIIADRIFAKISDYVEAIPLFNISDGRFPNHHPDPCIYENLTKLKNKVLETNADLGVGYDGDADRVGFVDEKGQFIEIDKFMIIMWKYLYTRVDNKACLFDVKCSKALEDELIKLGVKPVEYRTGNSYTRAASAEGNYPLSGELSGHVYFRDKFPGYDDGIYVGMRLIEMLSYYQNPLSSFLESIPKYYATPEIKIKSDDVNKFKVVDRVRAYCEAKGYEYITIDGAKVKFKDGFALVRASNTGPNITMRFEATTEKRMNELKEEFESVVNEHLDIGIVKNTINFSMMNGIISNHLDSQDEEELKSLKAQGTGENSEYAKKQKEINKKNKKNNIISVIAIILCFALMFIYINKDKNQKEQKQQYQEEQTTLSATDWTGVYELDNNKVYIGSDDTGNIEIEIYNYDDEVSIYSFKVEKSNISTIIENSNVTPGDQIKVGKTYSGISIASSSSIKDNILNKISGEYIPIDYKELGWNKIYSSEKYSLSFNEYDDHISCTIYYNGEYNSGIDIYGSINENELTYKSNYNNIETNVTLKKENDIVVVTSSSTNTDSVFNKINGLTFKS